MIGTAKVTRGHGDIPRPRCRRGDDVSMFKSAARGRESQHTVHPGSSGAATDLLSILQAAVGGPLPIRIRCWDGSVAGEHDTAATVVFVRRRGLRRLLWAPGELGLVRAYVPGA